MFGIALEGLRDLVVTRSGESGWQEVRFKAGLEDADLQSRSSYPDEMMYRVIGAASAKMNLPAAAMLEEFGSHWIRFVGTGPFGKVLEQYAFGSQPVLNLLENLDQLHDALAVLMPDVNTRMFDCEELAEDLVRLHYWSSRIGLAPMVTGFLRALGDRFNQPVNVSRERCTEDGAEHDTFLIEVKLRTQAESQLTA